MNTPNNILESANNTNGKKSYPSEFKDQIVAVYKSGIYPSVAKCAEAYRVNENTLYGWFAKYNKRTEPAVISGQQTELAQLKKELARAKMENEILKKAAIYFANQAQ